MENKTFQTYQDTLRTLSFDEMQHIHEQIVKGISGDKNAEEMYEELLKRAAKYLNYRATWFLQSREERAEKDSNRTSCHNSVITQINMLSRWLSKQGKDISWREELGDDEQDRKRIGDFACYLAFVTALGSR